MTDVQVADDRGWLARHCDAVERDGSQEVHAVDTVLKARAVKLPSRGGHREPWRVVGLDKKSFEAEKCTQERAGDSSVREKQSDHSVIRWDVVDGGQMITFVTNIYKSQRVEVGIGLEHVDNHSVCQTIVDEHNLMGFLVLDARVWSENRVAVGVADKPSKIIGHALCLCVYVCVCEKESERELWMKLLCLYKVKYKVRRRRSKKKSHVMA